MKTELATVLIISVFALSCRKPAAAPPFNNLCGAWKNIGFTSGGFAANKFTAGPDSVKTYLQFSTTRMLFNTSNSQTCTGYTFTPGSTDSFAGLLILTDTTVYPRQYDVSLKDDTLLLYPHGAKDGLTTCYARSLKVFNWCDTIKGALVKQ